MRRFGYLGWAALVLFGLVGCGGDNEKDQSPREVVGSYQAGFLGRDFDRACEQLSGEAARFLIGDTDLGDEEETCPAALQRVNELAGGDEIALLEGAHGRLDEASVRIRGGAATVDIPNGPILRLVRAGGRWYIADTSADRPLLPTAQEVRSCLKRHDAFNVEITDVAEPNEDSIPLILGVGPGGGRVGVLLTKTPFTTEEVTSELASEFEARAIDEQAVIVSDGKAEDEEVAEICVGARD